MAKHLCGKALLVFLAGTLIGCKQSSMDGPQDEPAPSSSVKDTKSKAKRVIKGSVLAFDGQAATDVEVAKFWSANGKQWNDDGDMLKQDTAEASSEFWNDEGEMDSRPRHRAKLFGNGQFEIAFSDSRTHVLLALNQQRTHGGLAYIPPQSTERLTIRLEPLVRVYGEIRCDEVIPDWTCAAIYLGDVKEDPD